jgi:hypothetical protein
MSGSVTIQELQNAATELGPPIQISSEIGNVIEVNDLNDDLGLNLLANQTKSRDFQPSVQAQAQPSFGQAQPSFGSAPIRLSVPDESNKPIQFDNLEPIELNTFSTTGSNSNSSAPASSFGLPEVSINRESNPYENMQSSSAGPSISLTSAAPRDLEKERADKAEYLNKLQRLESKGFPVSKRFTMDNSIDEIKQEFTRLVDARNLEASLRFQRQMLMGAITGMEWLNNKFDPFDVKLEGWSESVHTNVEDFDEIFEELYDKYKERGKMPPEMRLMFAVAGSGFMCHVSNSFFRSKMPSMDDVLRQNPMLAKQMAQAAAASAGPGFGNFMGMAMGMPPGMGQQGVPMQAAPMDPPGPTGAFFGSSGRGAPNPSPAAQAASAAPLRREMKGPSGVDDILKTFEEVRRTELESMGRAPPPNNSVQPAMVAAELQSLASEDLASQAESTRTGGGSGRRRGRKAAPVGNMLSMDV